jgi:hypothetical protein
MVRCGSYGPGGWVGLLWCGERGEVRFGRCDGVRMLREVGSGQDGVADGIW